MTPIPLASAIAAALLDGPWKVTAMVARLRDAFEDAEEPWMLPLARGTRRKYRTAPRDAPRALASWLQGQRSFAAAASRAPALVVRHWATPSPEMRPSRWSVPALHTAADLAALLGIDVATLEVLADRRGLCRSAGDPRLRHYCYTWIAKPTGGRRLLEAPKARLKAAQRRVLDEILAHIPAHDAAHGFRVGRSLLGFVAPHVHRPVVVRVDLRAFFTSVLAGRVYGIFRTAGYPEDVAWTLAAICTHRTPDDVLRAGPPEDRPRLRAPHLPQGAPSSGALANLAAYRLDLRVAALASSVGGHYSRYADDLVISGERQLVRAAPRLVARLGAIAIEEGFALNFRKTRVMTAAGRQRITGIVVNEKPSLARVELDGLRAMLHNCVHKGPGAQNRDGHPDFRAHLLGRVSWVAQVDPAKGVRLRAMFERIAWP